MGIYFQNFTLHSTGCDIEIMVIHFIDRQSLSEDNVTKRVLHVVGKTYL